MHAPILRKSYPFRFFFLVYAISAPFWLFSSFLGESPLPDNIPLTDIGAALSPAIAACMLIYHENGRRGLLQFLHRVLDYRRLQHGGTLILSLLLMPALYGVTYIVLRMADIPVSGHLDLSPALLAAFAMFSIGAAVEEIGYSAYATDALQARYSPLATSLLIGVPWAVWHLPSMIQMGQTSQLIAWGLLGTIAFRVLTVWLYNIASCSLFVVVLAHAVGTTARSAFPGGRHGYEVANGAFSYGIIILAALCVGCVWSRGRKRRTAPRPGANRSDGA